MRRRTDFYLIFGIFLFAFGLASATYGFVAMIIRLFFGYLGIVVYVKDLLFELVFILLGLLIIRKKKSKKYLATQRKTTERRNY
ncbi:MAG: hypothetical protein ACXACO_03950 [Promethearchaeota archaeon]